LPNKAVNFYYAIAHHKQVPYSIFKMDDIIFLGYGIFQDAAAQN
jgi:hypothetical protein